MRIAVCVQEYYPSGSGIGNVAHYLVKELKKLGHTPTIISPKEGDIKLGSDKLIKYLCGFGIIYFWRQVYKYLTKNKKNFDLIWVHNPLFLNKINFEVMSTVHTTYKGRVYGKHFNIFAKIYYFIMKKIESFCYNKNKFKTNIISKAVEKELKDYGLKQIKYIPNGVDVNFFKPNGRFDFNFNPKYKYGICLSRVAYQKNPFGLIKAIEEANKHMKLKLLWAGSGELFEKVNKFIKNNKIKHTTLLGKVKHEKVP
ncbi:glycosyltransferase family 4 protein, partial [Candidatus Woesearchaeota archaeon]|nr:glycosyltransferase family 4 protein [Candidatus Woesearchaeota archaeon]